MLQTRVANCRLEPYQEYIGRPTEWGNPFSLHTESDRKVAVAKYVAWLAGLIKAPRGRYTVPPTVERIREELRGKVLGCYCKPRLCHGDVLAEIANTDTPDILNILVEKYDVRNLVKELGPVV